MIADVFKATCVATWEDGETTIRTADHGLVTTGAAWEIASLFGGRRRELPGAGIDVIEFPDGSNALCGTRGASIIATWENSDHGDADRAVETIEDLTTYTILLHNALEDGSTAALRGACQLAFNRASADCRDAGIEHINFDMHGEPKSIDTGAES